MKHFLTVLALVATPAFAHPAMQSDDFSGTMVTTAQRQTEDGRLSGCSVGFTSLERDYTYRNGGYTFLTGNLTLTRVRDSLMVSSKLSLSDADIASGTVAPNIPYSVELVGYDGQSNAESKLGSFVSDTGGRLTVYRFDDHFMSVVEGILHDKLTILYNRRQGGTDVPVTIDLTVANYQTPNVQSHTVPDFGQCVGDLTDAVEKDLKSRQ